MMERKLELSQLLGISPTSITALGANTFSAQATVSHLQQVGVDMPRRNCVKTACSIATTSQPEGPLVELLIIAFEGTNKPLLPYNFSEDMSVCTGSASVLFRNITSAIRDCLWQDLVVSNPSCYHIKSVYDCFCKHLVLKRNSQTFPCTLHYSCEDTSETIYHDAHLPSELFSKGCDIGMKGDIYINLQTPVSTLASDSVLYCIIPAPRYTAHDALMYSPAAFESVSIKTLFVLYQLLRCTSTFGEKYFCGLDNLYFENIGLDPTGCIEIGVLQDASMPAQSHTTISKSVDDDCGENMLDGKDTAEDSSMSALVDSWVCGRLSNYDYLMLLNKLSGRSKTDPNHYPILPWVSTLEAENGSWRDLTKSKYRLNKGDHQLDIQFLMMSESTKTGAEPSNPNLHQVPHHLPEFLSDITYYVYMARRTPKDVLCKLVRSYWEPNEYPSSIQRMQKWTPDECIPEFYTDPSVFKSMHRDMADLAVPDWCSSASDFVQKHRRMLESDQVSRFLHHWIDITFGYKLSGVDSVEEKNVCLPLVDNHTSLRNRGITQLFTTPHPERKCDQKVLCGLTEPAQVAENSELPTFFHPTRELRQLEKLVCFKLSCCNDGDSLIHLPSVACEELTNGTLFKTALLDRNLATFICLAVELYLPLQTRTVTKDLPLHERFQRCLHSFELHRADVPSGVQIAMDYFIRNFRKSQKEAIRQLGAQNKSFCSLFKAVSDKGLPPYAPALPGWQYIHIFPFPSYFEEVYDILENILVMTCKYSVSLKHLALHPIGGKIYHLLDEINELENCLEILIPHLNQLMMQNTVAAAEFLFATFEPISKAMGLRTSQIILLPNVIRIYRESLEVEDENTCQTSISLLYQKSFLLQLSIRFGLKIFLERIPVCLANAFLAASRTLADISQENVCWLMEKVGPTLSSKYFIRPLFNVLSRCYIRNEDENDTTLAGCEENCLRCLAHAAHLYGSPIITLQYFAHATHCISAVLVHNEYARRHQAAIETGITLVAFFITYLPDTELMEQVTRISKEIVHPVIKLLGRSDKSYFGGVLARKFLCHKVIQLMTLLIARIGREMSQMHLSRLVESFFSNFGQPEQEERYEFKETDMGRKDHTSPKVTTAVGDCSSGSRSEIHETFSSEIAYASYVRFSHLLGDIHMKNMLGEKYEYVSKLSVEYESQLEEEESRMMAQQFSLQNHHPRDIRIIGNKLVMETRSEMRNLRSREVDSETVKEFLMSDNDMSTGDEVEPSIRKTLRTLSWSQLTENWLAYWEHEIGLPESDQHIHFNQIELMEFPGHYGAVKCLSSHPSEEWFVSAGKDKVVRIWSLSDNGLQFLNSDSQKSLTPSCSYKCHRKPVSYTGIVETEQLVLSNDGSIHAWDPYSCQRVLTFDSTTAKTGFSLVATLSSPNRYALAVTNEADLRFIDFRRKCLAHEFKAAVGNSVGLPRAICVSRDSYRVSIGFSTGMVSTVDTRIGTILSMKPAHEADILAMASAADKHYITASADQTVAIWQYGHPSPVAVLRGFQESIHTVKKFNDEIICASVANRVFVHELPDLTTGFKDPKVTNKPTSVSRIRSDSLRGALTTLCVLPMKRQVILASDNGEVKLMA